MERVRELIVESADLEARDGSLYDCTALQKAARRGHEEVVRVLCDAGAEVFAMDDEGKTTIDMAWDKATRDAIYEAACKQYAMCQKWRALQGWVASWVEGEEGE